MSAATCGSKRGPSRIDAEPLCMSKNAQAKEGLSQLTESCMGLHLAHLRS